MYIYIDVRVCVCVCVEIQKFRIARMKSRFVQISFDLFMYRSPRLRVIYQAVFCHVSLAAEKAGIAKIVNEKQVEQYKQLKANVTEKGPTELSIELDCQWWYKSEQVNFFFILTPGFFGSLVSWFWFIHF